MNAIERAMIHVGWGPPETARRLEVSEGTVRDWIKDRRQPPPEVAPWVERQGARLDEEPAPPGWFKK